MDIKFVPLTPEIRKEFRARHKHGKLRHIVEMMLATADFNDALEIKVPEGKWDYTINAVRSIIYQYNQDLRHTTPSPLSVRARRHQNAIYVYKNTRVGFDRYLI